MISTIIEAYLKAIDQATFQKLMNHLLWLEGYTFLGSPGAVVGRNKTSPGTPDSFFEDGDKYIFCEYTTQERLLGSGGLLKKLKADIDHCFDINASGVPKEKIAKVILAFTEKIEPEETEALKNHLSLYNSNTSLKIFSIQEIPFHVCYYPGFAEKYIPGVNTAKGTIYTLADFLDITTRGIQPSLTNPFLGREEEIKQAKDLLSQSDVLILTGHQGVGKSKLATHMAALFETDYHYESRIIVSSPVQLWDDLNNFILPDRNYFIVVDDGNKALPNLQYLLQFALTRKPHSIKVIITVRDYARRDLDILLSNHKFSELPVDRFDDKQIGAIVAKSLPSGLNLEPLALERITLLAKGNCRIALMASAIVLKSNNLKDLYNAETLYNEYFKRLADEVSFLKSPAKLNALGILSFFGVIDRNNEELAKLVAQNFQIDWNDLWETFLELEKSELVDVFSQETVKISDQVMATYAFYKAFIDHTYATISYSTWITLFLDKYHGKIQKSITDVINTFGYYELKDRLNALLSAVQDTISADREKLYKFYEIFWFYRDVDTLMFVKNWVNDLEEERYIFDKLNFAPSGNNYIYSTDYVELLTKFWYQNTTLTPQAITIGLQLAFKQPSRIPDLLKLIIENFSFHRYDYREDYIRQQILFDAISTYAKPGMESEISNLIFLSISNCFLECDSTQVQGISGGRIGIYTFQPPGTKALKELRLKVLKKVFSLFGSYPNKILDIMEKYSWGAIKYDADLYAEEQITVNDFFISKFSKSDYRQCKIVKQYVNLLKRSGIEELPGYSEFIDSEIIQLSELLLFDENYDSNYEQRVEATKQKIKDLIKVKDASYLETVFSAIQNIIATSTQINDSGVQVLLITLVEMSPDLFYKALEIMMRGEYTICSNEGWAITYAIRKKLISCHSLFALINKSNYTQKQIWKQAFFSELEQNDIDEYFLNEFIKFLSSLQPIFYAVDIHAYDKYTPQFIISRNTVTQMGSDHTNFVTYASEILLVNSNISRVSFARNMCEKCLPFFELHLPLLKNIFIYQKNKEHYYDYNGSEFEAVSTYDHYFLIEYLNKISVNASPYKFEFDDIDASFVWGYPEHEEIIDQALEIINSKAPVWNSFEHTANTLFKKPTAKSKYLNNMLSYISKFISKNHASKSHMLMIMNVVIFSFPDQVLRFFKELIFLNHDVELIKALYFEKGGAYAGSRVPRIDKEIDFTKQQLDLIKGLPNSLDYVDHIKYFETKIGWLHETRQRELKNDFKDWED